MIDAELAIYPWIALLVLAFIAALWLVARFGSRSDQALRNTLKGEINALGTGLGNAQSRCKQLHDEGKTPERVAAAVTSLEQAVAIYEELSRSSLDTMPWSELSTVKGKILQTQLHLRDARLALGLLDDDDDDDGHVQ